jgi:hypothetical protein
MNFKVRRALLTCPVNVLVGYLFTTQLTLAAMASKAFNFGETWVLSGSRLTRPTRSRFHSDDARRLPHEWFDKSGSRSLLRRM